MAASRKHEVAAKMPPLDILEQCVRLFESMRYALLVIDAEGGIVLANDRASEILEERDVTDMPITAFVSRWHEIEASSPGTSLIDIEITSANGNRYERRAAFLDIGPAGGRLLAIAFDLRGIPPGG